MSAPLADKLEFWGFHSDFVLFKDGSLGCGFALTPIDVSCWDDARLDGLGAGLTSLVNGWPAGLDLQFSVEIAGGNAEAIERHRRLERSAEPTVELLQRLRRERLAGLDSEGRLPRHSFRLFIRKPIEGSARVKRGIFQTSARMLRLLDERLAREATAMERLRDELRRELEGLGLTVSYLAQRDIAALVYQQWNPSRPAPLGDYDPDDARTGLLYTDVAVNETGFSLARTHFRVLSLKVLPDQTFSAMAKALGSLPFDSTLYLSIHVPDQKAELDSLQTQRRLAFAMARGKQTGAPDIDSEAKFQDLEDLISQMIAAGERIFHVSLNVVLRGTSEEELSERAGQALARIRELGGAEAMEETIAAFDIFTDLSLPHARSRERVRRMKTSNLIDFLPLYGPWPGLGEPRILLRSVEGDLVGLDPFAKELSNYNQMITGGSGSGKSFLTNLCLLQMLKEDPRVFVVDIGGSYRKLCENLSGQYIPFHLSASLSLNPFDLAPEEIMPSSHKIKFLVGLVEMLTKEDGTEHLGKLERAELEEAIQHVYKTSKAPSLSMLRSIFLDHPDESIRRFGKIVTPWCGDTPYGRIVDGPTSIELTRSIVCFDLKGLEVHPDLQAVCLYLITDFVWREVQRERSRIKFLVLDECWKLLESASGAAFIAEVFRTFRKYFASAIAISQNVDDFARSRVASAILPNTATKWVLSQRGADMGRLKEVLQLNDSELAWIGSLHQERGLYSQAFLMAGDAHAVVAIEPTPLEYWIATTDPRDLAKFEEEARKDVGATSLDILRRLAESYPRGVAAEGEL